MYCMNMPYVMLFIFLMMNKKSEALFSAECSVLHYFSVLLLCICALMLQLFNVFTALFSSAPQLSY